MDEGWIKLPRNLLDTAVFLDERVLKLLIWCKFRANCGNFRQPLPKLSLAEATTPAGFDRWIDRQSTFDKTDRYRQSLHAVRCSVARLFRQAEVARDQLQARLLTLADGRPLLDPPRAEDEQQARREID